MKRLTIKPKHETPLSSNQNQPEQVHVFDEDTISAVNAAISAKRPLLVRGEPGIGKSQLARAVAKELKRAYILFVVDARSESRDLLWEFDAIARLAEAQLAGAMHEKPDEARNRLAVENFLKPGPLWWAFDWNNAQEQANIATTPTPTQRDGGDPANGVVVLIDEIDKAESDVPNGLLEALGAGEFTPQGRTEPVTIQGTEPPLIIITSNEERALPDAFVRRCLVFYLELDEPGAKLQDWLVARGQAHFSEVDDEVLRAAAKLLSDDRKEAIRQNLSPKPGQAEYLDLLRAVIEQEPEDVEAQKNLLQVVSRFTLNKHQGTG